MDGDHCLDLSILQCKHLQNIYKMPSFYASGDNTVVLLNTGFHCVFSYKCFLLSKQVHLPKESIATAKNIFLIFNM